MAVIIRLGADKSN